MTLIEFKRRLIDLLEKEGDWVTFDNTDTDFQNFSDGFLVVNGEDHTESFMLEIAKVDESNDILKLFSSKEENK